MRKSEEAYSTCLSEQERKIQCSLDARISSTEQALNKAVLEMRSQLASQQETLSEKVDSHSTKINAEHDSLKALEERVQRHHDRFDKRFTAIEDDTIEDILKKISDRDEETATKLSNFSKSAESQIFALRSSLEQQQRARLETERQVDLLKKQVAEQNGSESRLQALVEATCARLLNS